MPVVIAILAVVCTAFGVSLVVMARRYHAVNEAFRVLSTGAPIGILHADQRGMCTFANDAWCEISGLSRSQTLGHAWSQAVHPDDLPGTMRKWEESVRERRPYSHEVRLVRPDGSQRQVLACACPTHDARGSVTGFIGTVVDVTGHRDAERIAREKDSLLRALVEHSSAAIYLKDAAGRFLLINRSHADYWPGMREFRPGTSAHDWFPADVAEKFVASDAEVIRSADTRTFEETVRLPDGPRTFLTVKFPVFDDGGQVVAVGGISADVSDLAAARRELAERERLLRKLIDLQEAEKRLLCHEFHDGLIQYAIGSKMLLESIRDAELPAAAAEVIESVVACLGKGIEDGRRVIRGIRPAALDDLGLRAAIEDLVEDVRASGLEVEAAIDEAIDALPQPLQTTAYRVVQESLTNARKHSQTGRLTVAVTGEPGRLAIEVEDFGAGFDVDEITGEGLGLFGLRERVRLAGGQCSIDSVPGRGTRVSVRLPWPVPLAAVEG